MIEVIICLSLLGLLHVRRKILRLTRENALLIEAIKCLLLLRLLLVRRKILRLYWAGAIIYISKACFYNIQAAVS